MSEPISLTLDHLEEITRSIMTRQNLFPDEPIEMSIGVVLANYGSGYTEIQCVNGEWSGTKNDLRPGDGGIPKCPNGHVMVETSLGKELALVDRAGP